MKRISKSIFCNFQFEWFHRWKDAPEEVKFLRDLHRHMFHVRVEVPVTHSDRQIEFILFKRDLMGQIENMKEDLSTRSSCEMIAEWFINYVEVKFGVDKVTVEVSEDGENGAVVTSEKHCN